MKTTVVLVHGAWHGAWCFDRVIPLLEEAGVPALAVDLPGHGGDEGPFTDLHGDAAYVWATLDGIDGEVVLLGHSYSGAVITEAGVHPSVRHPVYLCAMALDLGESCQTAVVENMAALSEMGDRASSTVSLWMGEALQHWIQYPQRHASITNVMSKT